MNNFIQKSLLSTFGSSPLIRDMIQQVDFTGVENKYSEALLSQFTNEEWTLLNLILNSGVYSKYIECHNRALDSCAVEIAEIIDFVSNFEDTSEH